MKRRDLIGILIAVAIFSLIGVLLYTQLAPAPKNTEIKVVVPAKVVLPLQSDEDKKKLSDLKALEDYSKPPQCEAGQETCKATSQ